MYCNIRVEDHRKHVGAHWEPAKNKNVLSSAQW